MAAPVNVRVLPHLRPARNALLLGVLAGFVGGLATVAQAFAVGTLIVRLVTDPGAAAWHAPGWWLVLITLVRVLAGWVSDACTAAASGRVSTALRERLLDSALRLEADERDQHTSGELTVLATRGLGAIEPYLTRYLPTLVLAAVLPVATVVAILALDWLSGLIVVLTLPLVPVFAILIGLATQAQADKQWRQLQTLSGHFLDVIRGLPTLVSHRRARAQSGTIASVTDAYRRSTVHTLRTAFASSIALELVATLSVALVAVCVGLRLAGGSVDFRTALIVLLLAPEAYWPLRRVGAEFHSAAEGVAAFAQADALLEHSAEPRLGSAPVSPTGRLRLDHVGLTYPGRERAALAEISHTFPSTGLVAVAGPSGCGKSTLLALLLGERSPSTGRVLLGDTDLAICDHLERRELMAWAPQRPWLSSGSIADNLRLARPEAVVEELWRALESVDLAAPVRALPDQLDTLLGEDGAGLSAGQRARLSLARVVLAERPIVLLDEPSAHLDAVTEAVLLRTLSELGRTRLVIVVAHREAVLEAADEILTLGFSPVEARTGTPSSAQLTPALAPITPPPAPPETVESRFGTTTGTLLGTLSVTSGVALTATAAWLITRASEHPPVLYLMVAIVGVRLFGLARPVLRYAERLVSHDAALRLLAQRRVAVYDALVPLVPGALGRRRGDLLASVVDDVDAVLDSRLRVRQPIWTGLLVGALAAVLAGAVVPVAGLLVGSLVLGSVLVLLVVRGLLGRTEATFVAARAELTEAVEYVLHNARELVIWRAEATALNRVRNASDRMSRATVRSARIVSAGHAVILALSTVTLLGIAALAGNSGASAAMLALITMLPLALVDALGPLPDAAALSVRTRAAEDRLEALRRLPPAVIDPDPAVPLPDPADSVTLSRVRAGWGHQDAIQGLDLCLPAGTRVGLVGPSGSGKSTVAALIMRFLSPRSGEVAVNGVSMTRLRGDEVRSAVGMVDDDPYLFASTVLENVRLARPEATDTEVIGALERARLGDWLSGLPDGVATFIGEGHAHVSGGERARIEIARQLLADPAVLVLDEPTAHLDSATAHEVADEILSSGVSRGRSTLWITHGTVGLDRMDQIVTLAR